MTWCRALKPVGYFLVVASMSVYPRVTAGQLFECHSLLDLAGNSDSTQAVWLKRLQAAESTLPLDLSDLERASCLKLLADRHRDLGSYEAERLYLQALNLMPDHPEILEALGRYYRNYRGSEGLFAESESFYVRALAAIEVWINNLKERGLEPSMSLRRIREMIVRGRVELYKREGVGLIVPDSPRHQFGAFLGVELEEGGFPIAFNDLTTPARTLLNIDPTFDPRQLLRSLDRSRLRSRLRFRFGRSPLIDVAWNRVSETDTLVSQATPVVFSDLDVEDLELAIEDQRPLRQSDLVWRLEYRNGDFDVEGPALERFERYTASATWTRNISTIKASIQGVGSIADVDVQGSGRDLDYLVAITAQLLHYRSPEKSASRAIDPRGFEYRLGFVQRAREFGADVELVQTSIFAGAKLTELLHQTDLEVLSNYSSNAVLGKSDEDSEDLLMNLAVTHRLVDHVNDMTTELSQRQLGLVQWSVGVGLFEDYALGSIDVFESQGVSTSTFIELFCASCNYSTLLLGGSLEYRYFPRIDEIEKLVHVSLRIGF